MNNLGKEAAHDRFALLDPPPLSVTAHLTADQSYVNPQLAIPPLGELNWLEGSLQH